MSAQPPTDEGAARADVRALREKAREAHGRGDRLGMLLALYEALERDAQARWVDLMRVGQFLHLAGRRAESLSCFRRACAMPGHRVAPWRLRPTPGADTLVIGFCVFNGTVAGYKVNFFRDAGLMSAHRLLLWDREHQGFLGGLPRVADGYEALLARLRRQVARLSPRRIVITGSSLSAYAALLYGHALGADVVHAFSPPAFLDVAVGDSLEPEVTAKLRPLLTELNALPLQDRALLDLREVLRRDNGKSRYFVHFGTGRRDDTFRAHLLEGRPGVTLIAHATRSHMVAQKLAKQGLLARTFAATDAAQMPRLRRRAAQPPA